MRVDNIISVVSFGVLNNTDNKRSMQIPKDLNAITNIKIANQPQCDTFTKIDK